MSEKSIWFRRIIKMLDLDFKDATYNTIIQLMKKKFFDKSGTPSSLFSRFVYDESSGIREKKWNSNSRLKNVIDLMEKMDIYEKDVNTGIFNIKSQDTIRDLKDYTQRGSCLEKCCDIAIKKYNTSLPELKKYIKSSTSNRTIYQITRGNRMVLTNRDLLLLEAILQIYGDVSSDLNWTGKICFGTPPTITNLQDKLSDDHKSLIKKCIINTKGKTEAHSCVKNKIKQNILPKNLEIEIMADFKSQWTKLNPTQ